MKKIIGLVMVLLLAGMVLSGCGNNNQEKYPTGTVEIVVPYAAGGGMDLFARTIQPYLAEKGIQTVVTNMPGGSTSIASMEVYNAPADGYKILCSGLESIISYNIAGLLEIQVSDLSQLGCVVYDAHIIIVPKDSPFETVDDLVQYAKEHPGELNWAGTGMKGPGEIGANEFWNAAGISMNYVPYESAANTRVAVMGNNADVGMVFVPEAKALLESGDIRGLAVMTAERSALFPDIPTLTECGYSINNGLHRGFFAQKNLPAEIQKVLAEAIKSAYENEAFKEAISQQCGFDTYYISPEECLKLAEERKPVFQELYNTLLAK